MFNDPTHYQEFSQNLLICGLRVKLKTTWAGLEPTFQYSDLIVIDSFFTHYIRLSRSVGTYLGEGDCQISPPSQKCTDRIRTCISLFNIRALFPLSYSTYSFKKRPLRNRRGFYLQDPELSVHISPALVR